MDPEGKKLLKEVHELVEENNKMLHRVRGVQKRQSFFTIVHWVFVIGVAVGAFYFLQPYIEKVKVFYNDVSASVEKIKGVTPK